MGHHRRQLAQRRQPLPVHELLLGPPQVGVAPGQVLEEARVLHGHAELGGHRREQLQLHLAEGDRAPPPQREEPERPLLHDQRDDGDGLDPLLLPEGPSELGGLADVGDADRPLGAHGLAGRAPPGRAGGPSAPGWRSRPRRPGPGSPARRPPACRRRPRRRRRSGACARARRPSSDRTFMVAEATAVTFMSSSSETRRRRSSTSRWVSTAAANGPGQAAHRDDDRLVAGPGAAGSRPSSPPPRGSGCAAARVAKLWKPARAEAAPLRLLELLELQELRARRRAGGRRSSGRRRPGCARTGPGGRARRRGSGRGAARPARRRAARWRRRRRRAPPGPPRCRAAKNSASPGAVAETSTSWLRAQTAASASAEASAAVTCAPKSRKAGTSAGVNQAPAAAMAVVRRIAHPQHDGPLQPGLADRLADPVPGSPTMRSAAAGASSMNIAPSRQVQGSGAEVPAGRLAVEAGRPERGHDALGRVEALDPHVVALLPEQDGGEPQLGEPARHGVEDAVPGGLAAGPGRPAGPAPPAAPGGRCAPTCPRTGGGARPGRAGRRAARAGGSGRWAAIAVTS